MSEQLLRVSEVARASGLSEKAVYRAIDRRELRATRLGVRGGLRIRPEWVEDWIESRVLPDTGAQEPTDHGQPARGRLTIMPGMGR